MSSHKVTIKDIAAEAGVSVALVSFVMNNRANGRDTYRVNKNTAERIMDVARRLNYRPNNAARSLRSGKTFTIGVILSDISNKFFSDIARRIEDRATFHNYTVMFGSTDENPEKLSRLIDVFLDKGIDGLIIVPCDGAVDAIRRVKKMDIPVALLDREVPDSEISSVVLDNRKACRQLTEVLVQKGCRTIEMVSLSMRTSNIVDREEGYREAIKKLDNSDNESLIHWISYDNIQTMREIVANAVSRGVEGLVFATNTLALAGLKALKEMNVEIAKDIQVAAFDSNDAFELEMLDINYVVQPIDQFGIEAVDLIMKLINNESKSLQHTKITLSPCIVSTDANRMLLNGFTRTQWS